MNVHLYLTVLAVSLGTKVQILSEGALNTMEVVVEGWIERCYPGVSTSTVTMLLSIIRGCFYVGCATGTLLTNFLPDRIGRRRSLLVTFAISITASAVNFAAVWMFNLPAFVLGRVLTGVAFGNGLGVGTMFINEISPMARRGITVGMLHASVGAGDIIGMLAGVPQLLGTADRWAFVFALSAVIALLPLPWLLLVTPETPSYLARTDADKAETSLRYYRARDTDGFIIKGELEMIKRELKMTESVGAIQRIGLWSLLSKPSYRRCLLLTVAVSSSTMLTGHVSVFSYSTGIWLNAGVSLPSAQLATVCMAVASPVSAVLSPLLVERLGRKPLLLASLAFCALSLTTFTAFSVLHSNIVSQIVTLGVLVSLATHVLGFNCAQSPRWALPGELLPPQAKSAATAFGDALYWLLSLLSAVVFLPWLRWVGASFALTPFLLLTLVCIGYLLYALPETKGRTVEQVVKRLRFFTIGPGKANDVWLGENNHVEKNYCNEIEKDPSCSTGNSNSESANNERDVGGDRRLGDKYCDVVESAIVQSGFDGERY